MHKSSNSMGVMMWMAIETNNFTLNERIEFLQTIIDSIMDAILKASQPA